ncbi:response regulator [Paenibacillus hexagrammi]|uniref:Response regulator n=1 Tax=Paenibacillus hexagrammi TaxID=2908839 RepID=A0ABY3SRM2_9BACL|nr:response regulator [Paenibacillus sp. YPD9-1]UJF36060.1 response regulator [Paenibacillus sp. YPD9-1]
MIRVLIVDDEATERMALQRIMEEGIPDVEIVGHACNGREAIEAAGRLRPDLITMDIKMPGIDGLQATEAIRESNENVKFIIVTAFDTFEFARQAIRLGVSDYLLKPSRMSVVLQTIAKVVSEIKQIQEERMLRDREKARLQKMAPIVEADIVSQLLLDYVPSMELREMEELWGLPSEQGSFVMNVCVSVLQEVEERSGVVEELYVKLIQCVESSSVRAWIGKMTGKQVPIVVFVESGFTYRNHAIGLVRQLQQVWSKMLGCVGFVGIGGSCSESGDLRRSYHEALLASADTSLPSGYCFYEDLAGSGKQAPLQVTFQMERDLLEEIRRRNWLAAADQVAVMIDIYEGAGQSIGMAQQRIFEVLIMTNRALQEMGIDVIKPYFASQAASYVQLKAEARRLIGQMSETAAATAAEMDTDQLLTLKQYIKQHANEDLSLEKIAATVDRNPYYVSKVFKEYFGMNYIDYLTDCRMETAKQLMQETDKSLKEITYEVGYHDPNYFSRVFRKIVGHSPTDYRKMLIKKVNKGQS